MQWMVARVLLLSYCCFWSLLLAVMQLLGCFGQFPGHCYRVTMITCLFLVCCHVGQFCFFGGAVARPLLYSYYGFRLLCSCSGVLGRFFIMLLNESVVGGFQGVAVIVITGCFQFALMHLLRCCGRLPYGYYAYWLSLVCCHVVAVVAVSGFQDVALRLLWLLFYVLSRSCQGVVGRCQVVSYCLK